MVACIGICSGFYVLSCCQGRNIPTEKIALVLNAERNGETKIIGKVAIEILLPEKFPEKHTGQLVRVAEKCTVKKNLENPPLFEIHTKRETKTETGNSKELESVQRANSI